MKSIIKWIIIGTILWFFLSEFTTIDNIVDNIFSTILANGWVDIVWDWKIILIIITGIIWAIIWYLNETT